MNTPQDFHTMLQTQLDTIETKTRLTQAEKLLRTCAVVIKGQSRRLAERAAQLDLREEVIGELHDKLDRIPRWVRSIFGA